MQIGDLNILFGEHQELGAISRQLSDVRTKHLLLSGLHASARALALAHIGKPMFVIFDNAEAAQYAYGDLKGLQVTGDGLQERGEKFIKDGQLYIRRDGHVYNILGGKVL